jgi:hypothetical protein
MKQSIKLPVMAISLLMLLSSGPAPEAPLGVALVQEAAAIVGVPWSPVSVAGVARRTTRRAVVVSGSYAAASYQQQTAVAEQQAATAQQQAAVAQQQAATVQQQAATAPQQAQRPAGAPPLGSIVTSLPEGCAKSTVTIGDVQYYDCSGVYYRAAFQGNNLVYVVSQP